MGIFGTKTVSTTDPRVSTFQVTESAYGAPISIVFGTTRVSGKMLDYDDFTAIAHTTTTTSGGKGGGVKSSQTSWTYTVAAAICLGEGPCTAVGKVWASKAVGDLDSNQMTLFNGEIGQDPWGYMVSKHPEKSLGYSGIAYVAGLLDLGSSASLPNYNFELYGLCQDQQGHSKSYVSSTNLPNASCSGTAPIETWTITKINNSFFSQVNGKYYVCGSVSGPDQNLGPFAIIDPKNLASPGQYFNNGKIQFMIPENGADVYSVIVSGMGVVTNNTNLTQQYAYQKVIEISNFVSNTSVQEYVYGQGWSTLDSRYYSIDQKEDSLGNKIPNVYVYTFNFDDRSDGYDRADPLNIRINYVATQGSVQYTPKDANPRDIIYEIIANQVFGCQFPTAYLDDWSVYSTYCKNNSLLLSPAINSQQQASDIISNLLEATNSEMVWSQGKAKLIPYYDGLTPIYDIADDNILDQEDNSIVITRNSQADSYNVVPLEYLDRANDYNSDTVYATDQGDIDLHGIRQMGTKSHHEIMTKALAQAVAQSILQKQLYIRNQYVVKLGQEFILLDPMDPVTLASEIVGLYPTPVRVVLIKESKEDYSLEFTFEDNPNGTMSAPQYEIQDSTRGQVNFNVDPGVMNPPAIFEPPAEITTSGLETWIAASGGPLWGGCDVWLSDDGDSYKQVGAINNPARYGNLTARLPANGDSLKIQLENTDMQLLSGTSQDAQNLRTVCWVDGEAIAYTTATLTGIGQYTLTGLIRGACNTPVKDHAAGSEFVRCDDAVFKYSFNKDDIGKTKFVKLTSFNIYGGGEQTLADVEAIQHTLTVQIPPDVTNIVLNEDTFMLKDGTTLSDIQVQFSEPKYSILDHYNVYYDLNHSGQWRFSGYCNAGQGFKIKSLPQAHDVVVKVTTVNKFQTESSGAVSSAYTITGKSEPPPDVTGLSAVQDEYNRSNIVLTWDPIDLATTPDLKGYEIRLGDVWETALKINPDTVLGNSFSYAVTHNASYSFLVKATDNSRNYSKNAVAKQVTAFIVPDSPTNFTANQDPKDRSVAILTWTATPGKDIEGYQIAVNGETYFTRELSYRYALPASGTYAFSIVAKTVAANYSNASNYTLTAVVEPYDVTGFTAIQSLSDRTKVTLMWDPPMSLDVAYFEIRQGPTWDSATVIGQRVSGTFYDVIVTTETPQTFWISAVSAAGKYSQNPASYGEIYSLNPSPVTNIHLGQDTNDKSTLVITWDGISESDLAYYELRVGYVWETATVIGQTKELRWTYKLAQTGDVKVMIKSKNAVDYSDEASKHYYATVEPQDVTGLVAYQNGETVELYWDKASEADVTAYEIHEGANFEQGQIIASGVTLNSYVVKVDTERNYQYFVKAINRSGHYSQNAVMKGIYVKNLLPKNVIEEFDEIALQNGTHSNTEFGPSLINFSNIGGKFSDYPTTKFSDVGGMTVLKLLKQASGTYPVSGIYNCQQIDVGQVITANITAQFISTVVLRGTGSARLQIRTSQNGTDWIDWQDFRPVQYTFRYAEFRVLLGTTDPTKTPEVNQFTIRIDVPDFTIRKTVTIPIGGATVNYGHTYYTLPVLSPTAIGEGLRPELISKTTSNATFKIKNASNQDVGGQLDLTGIGY